MTISHFCSLLGGLGLFLYGMEMMRSHLEEAAGKRMQKLLTALTATPLRGFGAGVGVTATVQSSSAVMVLLVGFVDSGILTLKQAVWVILGANIGTTITGQMIALDLESLAPLCAFAGIMLLLFSKKKRWYCSGGVLSGLGVLFIGLDMMGDAMMPLGESKALLSLLTRCGNPITGIFMGMLFTAIIQSSSASVGILQALAKNGLIGLGQSIYLVFGQNMGTCVTALLASAGTGCNAKRTAVIHLLVNVLGTLFFAGICTLVPFGEWMERLAPLEPAKQIANVHTVFNMATSLALLPFGGLLVKAAEKIVADG